MEQLCEQKKMSVEEFTDICIAYNKAQGKDIEGFQICPVHLWSMEHHRPCQKRTSGVHYCRLCNQPMCECGSHIVTVLSRITGYGSSAYVNGKEAWGKAKLQELRDRKRYNL